MGSRENLQSPQSPADSAHGADWQQGGNRKNSLSADSLPIRRTSVHEPTEHQQSTSEMFKDMLSQKRNMILSKLTSFDSEVRSCKLVLYNITIICYYIAYLLYCTLYIKTNVFCSSN